MNLCFMPQTLFLRRGKNSLSAVLFERFSGAMAFESTIARRGMSGA
jgi:hypothetical protein